MIIHTDLETIDSKDIISIKAQIIDSCIAKIQFKVNGSNRWHTVLESSINDATLLLNAYTSSVLWQIMGYGTFLCRDIRLLPQYKKIKDPIVHV